MFTSASPIDPSTAAEVCAELAPLFASGKRLEASITNAHHRCRGPMFIFLHPWLGEFAEAVNGYCDQIAERISALGGLAPSAPGGTEMPTDGMAQCKALLDMTRAWLAELGDAHAQCDERGWLNTLDLLTTVMRPLEERWGWYLASTCGGED